MQTIRKGIWRIEARATRFHPWIVVYQSDDIEDAARKAESIKRTQRFYATRVRVN